MELNPLVALGVPIERTYYRIVGLGIRSVIPRRGRESSCVHLALACVPSSMTGQPCGSVLGVVADPHFLQIYT